MAACAIFAVVTISIHAPPRGATSQPSCEYSPFQDFNSRPSARGDASFFAALRAYLFQFTPLREGRRRRAVFPRAEGISIHAPPRGATLKLWTKRASRTFQFTPLREGRRLADCTASRFQPFQFTPLREGRRRPGSRGSRRPRFQFTPLREGRPLRRE